VVLFFAFVVVLLLILGTNVGLRNFVVLIRFHVLLSGQLRRSSFNISRGYSLLGSSLLSGLLEDSTLLSVSVENRFGGGVVDLVTLGSGLEGFSVLDSIKKLDTDVVRDLLVGVSLLSDLSGTVR